MRKPAINPDWEKYFTYLDALRASGITNMWGATPYLQNEFEELERNHRLASKIMISWMKSFKEN